MDTTTTNNNNNIKEANSDNCREIFSIFYTIIVCCVYSLESPR